MKVIIRRAGRPDQEFEVGAAGLVLGRSVGGADVSLDDDPSISRRHGRLWLSGQQEVWYEDLGSSNGSWLGGTRLVEPYRLVPGIAVQLGEALLAVPDDRVAADPHAPLPPGMELRMRVPSDDETVARVLSGRRAAVYVTALYECVQGLLRSTSRELMHAAVRRIQEVVPSAQRVSLVAWPPDERGAFRPLVPGEESSGSPISLSLARYAVESGQALLLSEAEEAEDPEVGASVMRHGIRSAVYVPLFEGPTAVGVLCVDTPVPALPFTAEDFQFIRALGELLASALVAESLRDEARQKEMEAREREAHSRALEGFLQIASHDLKGPLTVIRLSAYMLGRAPLEESLQPLVGSILTSEARAQALIRSYLEVSAVDGNLRLNRELVELGALVDEELAFLRQATDEQQVLPVFVNRVAGVTLTADSSKLRQVLGNLMSNAAKYSPAGGEVTVSAESRDGELVVAVQDQGVGIARADQEELFHQFRRVGDQRLASGTGLGLWLTRRLVEAHGGRIWLESAPGEGSTFYFSLPGGPAFRASSS